MKYLYTVTYNQYGANNLSCDSFGDAPAAIAAANLVFDAAYTAHSGGIQTLKDTTDFKLIRDKQCTRIVLHDNLRRFTVEITKVPR